MDFHNLKVYGDTSITDGLVWTSNGRSRWPKGLKEAQKMAINAVALKNKTISDGGITVDFWFIKVHTSN